MASIQLLAVVTTVL
uniref:Uncharacterized protein n=1 Tax=Rhizophora mucronata TaxID=61149 RepID=A0A2P2J144_RHIMU